MIDLQGAQILIAEDEFLIADLLESVVVDSGGEAVGPVSTVRDGFSAAEGKPLAGALLDISLADGEVYPLAFALLDRRVPIIVISGNSRMALPPRCLPALGLRSR